MNKDRAKIQEAKKLFHELWGRDVGSPKYDKRKWMDLQNLLAQLGINL